MGVVTVSEPLPQVRYSGAAGPVMRTQELILIGLMECGARPGFFLEGFGDVLGKVLRLFFSVEHCNIDLFTQDLFQEGCDILVKPWPLSVALTPQNKSFLHIFGFAIYHRPPVF